MMFYVNQEDDDSEFGIASGGSKLANLFSSDQTNLEKQSPSLTYTAPKQPKKMDGQAPVAGSLTALHAVAVHAYKFENQQYSSQGKVGAALIGSHETSVYKILLYKGKQQQITAASLSPNFSFKIQANNYANFYDDKRENWSIMFDSEQSSVEFSKQVAVAKANSIAGNLSSIVAQDLSLGDGQEVGMGDAIEIKFTGWLLTNHIFGQVFDSNATSETLFRMKIGKSKVIKGWEEGLIGSKKNSRKLLIIPPSLAYGAQGIPDKVPPNSTLIFDIFVNKVKFSNSRDRSRSSTPSTIDSDNSDEKRADQTPRSHAGSVADDSVRSRGASLSEQMSHSPKSDKAKIISRMAKMGMPMLPIQGAIPTQPSSESDMEEEGQQSKGPPSLPPRTSSPKLPPKPRSVSTSLFSHPSHGIPPEQQVQAPHHMAGIPPVQQVAVLPPQQHYNPGIPYGYPFQQQMGPVALYQQPPFQSAPIQDAHLPVLLSETRTYNSEMRMALGKIMDKVDSLGNKIDDGGQSKNMAYMESTALLQNIQRIVEENTKLKQDLDRKNTKIQSLNEKINDLLQRNNKFVEESNLLLERKSDSLQSTTAMSQNRLLAIEQDRVKLSNELSEALSTITSLQLELQKREQAMNQRVVAVTGESQKHQEDVATLEVMVKGLETQVNGLQENIVSNSKEKDQLTSSIGALKSELSEVHTFNRHLEQNLTEKEKQLEQIKWESQEDLKFAHENYQKELEALRSKLCQQNSEKDTSWVNEKSSLMQEMKLSSEEKQRFQHVIASLEEQVQSLRLTQEGETKLVLIWKSKCEKLQDSFMQLRQENERNFGTTTSYGFEMDLKRAMNGVYRSLQREFDKESSYVGNDILHSILSAIRMVTVAVLEERQSVVSEDEHDTKNGAKVEEESVSSSTQVPPTADEHSSPSVPEDGGANEIEVSLEATNGQTSMEENVETVEASMPNVDAAEEIESVSTQGDIVGIDQNKMQLQEEIKGGVDNHVDANVKDNKTTEANNKGTTGSPKTWRPQPPPPPLFDDDEDEDDWLK